MSRVRVYRKLNGAEDVALVDQAQVGKRLRAGWSLEPTAVEPEAPAEPEPPKRRGRPKKVKPDELSQA